MAEPKVLVDATALPPHRGGVGRYVDALVAALDQAGTRLVVTCRQPDADAVAALARSADVVPAAPRGRAGRLAWEQTRLPALAGKMAVDVVHSPHYTMPLACPAASVVTLHDATFFTDPQWHTKVKAPFFRAWSRRAVDKADACIVPSQATATALRAAAGDRAFDVIAHGVDSALFHRPTSDDVRQARAWLGIGDARYIAFLGTLEPRKNVPALIDGFRRADLADTTLVLAGQQGWDETVGRALDGQTHVVTPGYVPVGLLSGYLGGADVVVYPSLGEGFGLPVLEAMACGACVLTSRSLALPEVGGDAVAYCGTSSQDIAVALAELVGDHDRRRRLGEAAVTRAGQFTWTASAEAHRAVYDRVAHARTS